MRQCAILKSLPAEIRLEGDLMNDQEKLRELRLISAVELLGNLNAEELSRIISGIVSILSER